MKKGDQFTCDGFHPIDSLRAEAAIQAVKKLNKHLGTKFGLIAIDTCFSIPTTMKRLTDILSGSLIDSIVGLIGDYSSHVTVEVSQKPLTISSNTLW